MTLAAMTPFNVFMFSLIANNSFFALILFQSKQNHLMVKNQKYQRLFSLTRHLQRDINGDVFTMGIRQEQELDPGLLDFLAATDSDKVEHLRLGFVGRGFQQQQI